MPAWAPVDQLEMQAYFGLLLLAGVYKSRGENTLSLWGTDGRAIFPAVMSRKRFSHISRMLRYDVSVHYFQSYTIVIILIYSR